jgi:membrane AbrB-like protein
MLAVGGWSVFVDAEALTARLTVGPLLQVAVGILVGLRISTDSLSSGARSFVPAFGLTAVTIAAGVASALAVVRLTSMDLITALFVAVPGGMTEMAAVAAGYGADGEAVVIVHLVRLLATLAIANLLLVRARGRRFPASPAVRPGGAASIPHSEETGALSRLTVALVSGSVGGALGLASQVPAGGIIGGLVGAAAIRLGTSRPVPVRRYQQGVQVPSGLAIGLGISEEALGKLHEIAAAVCLVVPVQLLLWFAATYVFVKVFGYEDSTANLATAPGGIGEMIATAAGSNADMLVVTSMHLTRLSAIVIVVPFFVGLVLPA